MINKIWKQYVLINYCGQRANGSFFTKRSVINIIMFEFSFITSAIPFGVMLAFGIPNPLVGYILAFIYVMILWDFFEPKVKKNINFEYCECYYVLLNRGMRTYYFIVMILLLMITFSFMIYSIKLIINLK
jgi:hypothetical protein